VSSMISSEPVEPHLGPLAGKKNPKELLYKCRRARGLQNTLNITFGMARSRNSGAKQEM
jgi:hypothetical protein